MVIQVELMVGVSKNHVHLTEETWKNLFGDKPMIKRNDLTSIAIETNQIQIIGRVDNNSEVVIENIFEKYTLNLC